MERIPQLQRHWGTFQPGDTMEALKLGAGASLQEGQVAMVQRREAKMSKKLKLMPCTNHLKELGGIFFREEKTHGVT